MHNYLVLRHLVGKAGGQLLCPGSYQILRHGEYDGG